jgi:radical SAM superfamily enzyme YgiQ (UPF0313 family)
MRKTSNVKTVVGIEPGSPGLHVYSRFPLPRLGLPLLGKILLSRGYDVRIYCSDLGRIEWDDVWRADMVFISTITSTAPDAYKIAQDVRKRDIPVVLGGPHVTFKPEEALEYADYVVRGEGEATIIELLEWMNDGDESEIHDIEGLSFRMEGRDYHNPPRPLTRDLDSLPFPDLSIVQGHRNVGAVPIITSRGCPFDCTFCSVTKMFGRGYRFRNEQKVVDEIEKLYSIFPDKLFFFYDDNFTANPRRTERLLGEILKRRIPLEWAAQTRADVAKDERLIALMKKAGCRRLFIGLESVNPETLKAYRKCQTVEEMQEHLDTLSKHDISVHGMFALGGDDDNIDTISKTVAFALKEDIDTVQFLILTPIPGSDLYRDMVSQGRIINEEWSEYDGHHVKFTPKRISPWRLQIATVPGAMARFYSLKQSLRLFMKGDKRFLTRIYGRWLITRWTQHNRRFLDGLRRFSSLQTTRTP